MLNLNKDAILVTALEPASTKDRCSWKGFGVKKANHQGEPEQERRVPGLQKWQPPK